MTTSLSTPLVRTGASHAALLSLIASGVVWGCSWWPLKYFAGHGLTGHAIGLTAYTFVAAIALPFIWRERRHWQSEIGLLVLIGLFFGCANLAFTTALTMGSVVRAMLLFFLLPCWGAIGGALFLHERIGRQRLVAVCLSLGGVLVILGGPAILQEPFSTADGLALAAGFFYTAAGIANRKAVRIPLASRTLASFVGCSVAAFSTLALTVPDIPSIPVTVWGLLLLFAFVWLMGGTLLTTYGVTHVAASRAAILQVFELLVAVMTAVWFGGESLGVKEYAGGAMILAATWLEATTQSEG